MEHGALSRRQSARTAHPTLNTAPESPPSPAFRLADVPDKGKGLLATRPFARGALLFTEAPLFTQPPAPACTNSSILTALAARTRDEQREYFLLANAHRRSKTVLPALGIFETNALPCGPGAHGLFLAAARLNHSCAPNVARAWDAAGGAMAFRALVPVPAGAELCVNYADVLGTRAERTAALRARFAFECRCAACTLAGAARDESDRRRAAVRRLFDEVGACANEPTLGLRKVKVALRLLEEEGLVHYRASFCFDAFQFCVLVSDFANAKAWVRKAWEATCSTTGPDSAAAHTFKMYWANPRNHHLAGTLPKMTLSGPE